MKPTDASLEAPETLLGRIAFKDLKILLEIVDMATFRDAAYIKSRFRALGAGFEECVSLLSALGLLIREGDSLRMQAEASSCMGSHAMQNADGLLKSVILERLLHGTHVFRPHVLAFFGLFEFVADRLELKATTSERVKYSGMRNLLQELGALSLDVSSGCCFAVNEFVGDFLTLHEDETISPVQLKRLLERQAECGRCAEEAVVEYERRRLKLHPELVTHIRHVAAVDTTAGFDVFSYEIVDTAEGESVQDLFIEVKAVSLATWEFFLSRNEVAKAQQLGASYCLYLVPVTAGCTVRIDRLKIVRGPYRSVIEGSNEWETWSQQIGVRLRTQQSRMSPD